MAKNDKKGKKKKGIKKGILGDGKAQNVINQKKKRKAMLEAALHGDFGGKERKEAKDRK